MGKGRGEIIGECETKGFRGRVLGGSSVWTVKLSRMWAGIEVMV